MKILKYLMTFTVDAYINSPRVCVCVLGKKILKFSSFLPYHSSAKKNIILSSCHHHFSLYIAIRAINHDCSIKSERDNLFALKYINSSSSGSITYDHKIFPPLCKLIIIHSIFATHVNLSIKIKFQLTLKVSSNVNAREREI